MRLVGRGEMGAPTSVANLCIAALTSLRDYLLDSDGINIGLSEIAARDGVYLPPITSETVLLEHVPPRIADENEPTVYPGIYLYCEGMENQLLEKFRKFSGRIWIVADVRVSGERFIGLEAKSTRYVEALAKVLEEHIGKWSDNLAYSGVHKVRFTGAEHGGRNFLQRAEVEIELLAHE